MTADRRRGRVLCVFGTASHVGKSWITVGLCRLAHRRGTRVAPFKAVNISNNAGVTPSGDEIARAQIVQAEACNVVPVVEMNPCLLKPHLPGGGQTVLMGKALSPEGAVAFHARPPGERFSTLAAALDVLRAQHALVVAEGMGSCAELNLRSRDLANFRVAEHGDANVVLVGDVGRGGVFAQLLGTLDLLEGAERRRVAALVINGFRGDPRSFEGGVRMLEERAGVPVLGVVPRLEGVTIDAEDDLDADEAIDPPPPPEERRRSRFQVAVLRLPHLANASDFAHLRRHVVDVHLLSKPRDLSPYDLLILPGSKNTRHDLDWVRSSGWELQVAAFVKRRGHVLGFCGGYQMMGVHVSDPRGVEGPAGTTLGLSLLPIATELTETKATSLVTGYLIPPGGDRVSQPALVRGYEIHAGVTAVLPGVTEVPMVRVLDEHAPNGEHSDGVWSEDGLCGGTYLHSLLDEASAVRVIAAWCRGRDRVLVGSSEASAAYRQQQYDRIADHLAAHLRAELLEPLLRDPHA